MDIRKLQRAIVDGLEDVKAQNIVVFNTEHLSPLFERVIVASGTSNRQTKALASSVREAVKSAGLPVLATEGEENGEWIIVDCGAAVAHIMQPQIRDYYRLEEIWGEKPVRMKLSAASKPLAKASEDAREPAAAAKKAAPRNAAAKPAPAAKKAGSGRAADGSERKPVAPAGRRGAMPTAAHRPAAKKAASRAGGVRKPIARKTARG
jgi:ribosome-associated protein